MLWWRLPTLSLCSIVANSSLAVTIGFNTLEGSNDDPYLGHQEGGLIVSPIVGKWYQLHNNASSIPSLPCLYIGQPMGIPRLSKLEIRRSDGGLFTFKSFDAMCSGNWSTMWANGYLGSEHPLAIHQELMDGGKFYTLSNLGNQQIDRLVLIIDPVYFADYMDLDTIVVEPVPEPAGFVAMSLAAAALYSRRRRSNWEGPR